MILSKKKKNFEQISFQNPESALKFENITFIYNYKTKFAKTAVNKVNHNFEKNKITAVIGNTGSGKSTLMMHANGLFIPHEGITKILNTYKIIALQKKIKNYKEIRSKIGFVFQFPENQLFEETVLKDIVFGPMNIGVKNNVAEQNAKEVIKIVNLPESVLNNSPFELSGGQKRRVAIAGILSMKPELLIFDEPTAGLDPAGEKEVETLILDLKKANKTIIFITHDMELLFHVADEVVVMDKGDIIAHGEPYDIFLKHNIKIKQRFHLINPFVIELLLQIKNCNLPLYNKLLKYKVKTIEGFVTVLKKDEK